MILGISVEAIVGFIIGLPVGYILKTILIRTKGEKFEQTIFGLIIVGAWLYMNIALQAGDFWLNMFMALVVVQVYNPAPLMKIIEVWKNGKS